MYVCVYLWFFGSNRAIWRKINPKKPICWKFSSSFSCISLVYKSVSPLLNCGSKWFSDKFPLGSSSHTDVFKSDLRIEVSINILIYIWPVLHMSECRVQLIGHLLESRVPLIVNLLERFVPLLFTFWLRREILILIDIWPALDMSECRKLSIVHLLPHIRNFNFDLYLIS